MAKKWQLRIHVGYIIKMGDNEIKGNERELPLTFSLLALGLCITWRGGEVNNQFYSLYCGTA